MKLKEEKRNVDEVNHELREKITNLETKLEKKELEYENLHSIHETIKENFNDYQKKNSTLEREILQLQSNCKSLEIAASTKQTNSSSVSFFPFF